MIWDGCSPSIRMSEKFVTPFLSYEYKALILEKVNYHFCCNRWKSFHSINSQASS